MKADEGEERKEMRTGTVNCGLMQTEANNLLVNNTVRRQRKEAGRGMEEREGSGMRAVNKGKL